MAILIVASTVFSILDRGLFGRGATISDGSVPPPSAVAHDHDLCVVFHANPGLPQSPSHLRERTTAAASVPPAAPFTPAFRERNRTCQSRAPPLA